MRIAALIEYEAVDLRLLFRNSCYISNEYETAFSRFRRNTVCRASVSILFGTGGRVDHGRSARVGGCRAAAVSGGRLSMDSRILGLQ
jgi:hypothetical protein